MAGATPGNGGGGVMAAYVEYAYRFNVGESAKVLYRVDCSLADFVARRALFDQCRYAYEIVWARVAGSLV